MRKQTDQEFIQNDIKNYRKTMFNSKTEGSKESAAKKKRELLKILFKIKKLENSGKSKSKAKYLLNKAMHHMNMNKSVKYDPLSKYVERNSLKNDEFREVYDFHRIEKVQPSIERCKKKE